jgi:hypothetical protein
MILGTGLILEKVRDGSFNTVYMDDLQDDLGTVYNARGVKDAPL